LEAAELTITGVNELTGLPEYRNGGLFLDTYVLELKQKGELSVTHSPHSELVVEWRALTVALLDELARKIRRELHKTDEEFPLVKMLQGGTWSAGRKIAKELRPSGAPPLQLQSTGTLF
jgi:hypothetical protein